MAHRQEAGRLHICSARGRSAARAGDNLRRWPVRKLPSSAEEGWLRGQKKPRSNLSPRRRGGVGQQIIFLISTTPAAAFIKASPYRARASRASAFPSSAKEGKVPLLKLAVPRLRR